MTLDRAMVQRSGRRLVLLWPRDAHCRATFDDLYAWPATGIEGALDDDGDNDDGDKDNADDDDNYDDDDGSGGGGGHRGDGGDGGDGVNDGPCDNACDDGGGTESNQEPLSVEAHGSCGREKGRCNEMSATKRRRGRRDALLFPGPPLLYAPLVATFDLDFPPELVDDLFKRAVPASRMHVYSFWHSPILDLETTGSTQHVEVNGGAAASKVSADEGQHDNGAICSARSRHVYVRSSYWLVSAAHGDTRPGHGSDKDIRRALRAVLLPSSPVAAALEAERVRVEWALRLPAPRSPSPPFSGTDGLDSSPAFRSHNASRSLSRASPFMRLQRVLVAVHIRMQVTGHRQSSASSPIFKRLRLSW
jgi:hypothetical protein